MNGLMILLVAAFAAPAVEVTTVSDDTVAGSVTAIDGATVTIEREGEAVAVPLESILEIRFLGEQPAAESAEIVLRLKDGGRLTCQQVTMRGRTVVAETLTAGTIEIPLTAVQAIRFRAADPAVEAKWAEIAQSNPERDLLVVRNGDVLDRLDGTISSLDAATLTFLVGDQRVPIDRTRPRLFGVVTGRAQPTRIEAIGELRFRNGDRLPVSSLALEGESLKVAPTSGGEAKVELTSVEAIDFGQGKVQFLSQMEPREKQHTPYFGTSPIDSVFDVRYDHSDASPETPIRIDRQTFKRGLVIHSRTKLVYRLNGEYRRFVAVAGIEQLVRPNGHVTLTISADGQELFRGDVTGTDAPIPLDLDVTGKRDLTIFVDFGPDLDDGDHLALGDARVIK